MESQTPEATAKAALASLIKSVTTTPSNNGSATSRTNQYQEPSSGMSSSSASTKLMENLWLLMTSLYGHKWTSVHGLSDIKIGADGKAAPDSGMWGKVLAGLNGQDFARGIAACIERGKKRVGRGEEDWPPSAPEFRAMCERTAADLGVPTVDQAFSECSQASDAPADHRWSHEIVRLAGKAVGWWEIRHCVPNEQALRKRFDSSYSQLFAKLQKGERLEEPKKMLEHEGATLTVDQAERRSVALANLIARDQGLHEKTPQELRQELLDKMGIKR